MTDLRTAAQQALEALEFDGFTPEDATHRHYTTKAITALKAALEQPEQAVPYAVWRQGFDAVRKYKQQPQQEPVAWRTFDGEGGYDYRTHADNEDYAAEWAKRNPRHVGWVERLYTAPPRREWRSLTEEDIWTLAANSMDSVLGRLHFARAIEARLKEKNHE
jgi:hypothetical protein